MNKSKKPNLIMSRNPAESKDIVEQLEREKETQRQSEEWQFNRTIQIQRIVVIAQARASRPMAARHYIKGEDKIIEQILSEPLPFNEYVDFNDDSDWGNRDLDVFCTRLAVRLITLNDERKRVKKASWSADQDAKIKEIDEAKKVVEFVLNNPTAPEPIIDKWVENYKNQPDREIKTRDTTNVNVNINTTTIVPSNSIEQGNEINKQKASSDEKLNWSEVEVAIYSDNRIGYRKNNSVSFKNKTLAEVGLVDKKTQEINKSLGMLIGISKGRKCPSGIKPSSSETQHMKRLRTSIRKLFDIEGANTYPFYKINDADGWRPKFKFYDRRDAADDRAKEKAVPVPYDDSIDYTQDFDKESDEAGDWLKKNDS